MVSRFHDADGCQRLSTAYAFGVGYSPLLLVRFAPTAGTEPLCHCRAPFFYIWQLFKYLYQYHGALVYPTGSKVFRFNSHMDSHLLNTEHGCMIEDENPSKIIRSHPALGAKKALIPFALLNVYHSVTKTSWQLSR